MKCTSHQERERELISALLREIYSNSFLFFFYNFHAKCGNPIGIEIVMRRVPPPSALIFFTQPDIRILMFIPFFLQAGISLGAFGQNKAVFFVLRELH